MPGTVLILAGTTEATQLARALTAGGVDVVSSLAGVTSRPVERPGRVRVGGFGGVSGLAEYLAAEQIAAVVDATHPFASVMPFNAAAACAQAAVPLLRLLREPWQPAEGDRWVDVGSVGVAAAKLDEIGAKRVFLAIGRQQLGAFAGQADQWFLVRSIEPPDVALPQMDTVTDRGPFTVESELALLRTHHVDTLVAKNSGGAATGAKLSAARQLGLTVVMVRRPAQPAGHARASTVEAAIDWVSRQVR